MNVARFLGTIALAWATWVGVAEAAPPLEAYGALPEVQLIRLSPSGQRYAFFAVVGGSSNLAVMSDKGQPVFAMNTGSTKVRNIRWAGDNHLLLTVSSTLKAAPYLFTQDYELANVLNIDVEKRTAEPVFKGLRNVGNAVLGEYGVLQVKGHLYAYFGGISLERDSGGEYVLRHGYPDLYRVDLDTGKSERIASGGQNPRDWLVAPDGSLLSHSEYNEQQGKWRLFAGGNGGRQVMERVAPLMQIGLIGLGKDDKSLLVEDETGIQSVVQQVSLADGTVEPLFKDVTPERFLFDPDSNLLIGALIQEEPKAVLFDSQQLARLKGTHKAFPGLSVNLESFSRGFARLVVRTEGGKDSGTYWLVDIASGIASPIGRSYPSISKPDVGETRMFRYFASDGVAIEAVLTLPPGKEAKGLPLVVMPHGGPIGVRDTIGFDWWAQAYAARGYAVLQPNYRGSSGYGRAFSDSAFGQWGRKMQTDLSDGIAALAKEGVADDKRVCIVGASYGGYAALAGVTLQHGIYRCAVSVAGLADLRAFFYWQTERHGRDSAATRYWRAVIGADKDGASVYADLSPSNAVARADAPILLIHGKDDTVVPLEQSEMMDSALSRANKPHELVVLAGEDHWLSNAQTRVATLKASVNFVEKYNPAAIQPTREPSR